MDILDLFKRRKIETTRQAPCTLENDIVDLTSDTDEEITVQVANAEEEQQQQQQQQIHPKPDIIEIETEIDTETVCCPVCLVDISKLNLEFRESHVELCLLQPSESSYVYQSSTSPKKTKSTQTKEEKPKKPKRPKKPLPDFKIITLEPHKVIVDGFCYADGPSDKYFLSHFHSDHYGGLTKNWSQGTIYCSKITADLARKMFNMPEERFVVIPLNVRTPITDDFHVTLYEANHCPGAVIFLFETPLKKVLHTGDFRVSKAIINQFKDIYIDEIYLDTTYLNPQYSFYDQRLVIDSTVNFIKDIVINTKQPKGILDFVTGGSGGYVILVGSYSIGKEKIYLDIARALNTKIFVTARRYETLKLSGMDMSLFEKDKEEGCAVYVVNFNMLSDKAWLKRFAKRHIIKVRPTGWSFTRMKKIVSADGDYDDDQEDYYMNTVAKVLSRTMKRENFEDQLKSQWERGNILAVPYSEHSSFKELTMFSSILKWGKIIPTVSVENQEFPKWFEAWEKTDVSFDVLDQHYR